MSTTTFVSPSQGFGSVVPGLVLHATDAVTAFVRAYRNRVDAAVLAEANDRMLADIGLTRSDVRDAFAEPLWHDPTDLLRQRVGERRRGRRS